jgi:hypothetical protein
MTYIPNPKTQGSGILCAIPQTGTCTIRCANCFFRSGRSYLEPLDENLPNLPHPDEVGHRIVRFNDGNDSNAERAKVIEAASQYERVFFNTCIPLDLDTLPGPVVLTVNPASMTDKKFMKLSQGIPNNLMFVRVRANTWNLDTVVKPAVAHYTNPGPRNISDRRPVPVVLTFMAYHEADAIPDTHLRNYYRYKRIQNEYYGISTDVWRMMMSEFQSNPWVHSCGKIEGDAGEKHCRHCGHCLREYFATMERMG